MFSSSIVLRIFVRIFHIDIAGIDIAQRNITGRHNTFLKMKLSFEHVSKQNIDVKFIRRWKHGVCTPNESSEMDVIEMKHAVTRKATIFILLLLDKH